MERKITIDVLLIFPNTQFPKIKDRYIICARCIEAVTTPAGDIKTQESYYMASTSTRQVYEHFWNNALSDVDKVPAITHMLYRLKQENGFDFRYIQPKKPFNDGHADGSEGLRKLS